MNLTFPNQLDSIRDNVLEQEDLLQLPTPW